MTAPPAPEPGPGAPPAAAAPTTGDAAVDEVLRRLHGELSAVGADDLQARRTALDTAHRALQALLEPDGT